MKSRSIFVFVFAVLLLFTFSNKSHAQCTWDSVYANSWNIATPDTNVLLNSTFTRTPANNSPSGIAPHSGSLYLYMNFTNTAAGSAGIQFYDRTFNVCPGAQYRVSYWLATTFAGNPCDVTIRVTDGTGAAILATTNTDSIKPVRTWKQFIDTFIATTSTVHFKMTTNVGSPTYNPGGNDLAMDDLLLQVCQTTTFDTVSTCATVATIFNLFDSIRPALATGGAWNGPSTLSGGSLGTYNMANNAPGTYRYSLINGSGCPNGLAQILVVDNTPNAALGPDYQVSLCAYSYITLTSPSPGYSNLWSDGSTGASLVDSTNGLVGLQVTHNGCVARDTTNVTFLPCTICPPLVISHDTTVCPSSPVRLSIAAPGGNVTSTVWSPAYGLSSTTSPTPLATTAVDTMYKVNITTRSNTSLIFNGDFSQGNTGFNSGYIYTTTRPAQPCGTSYGILGCDGYYTINTNPSLTHTNFANYGDHTTGTGQMLIANGSQNPNFNVWCQTINVLPSTDYQFSAWVSSCVSGAASSLPHLKFFVDGISISSGAFTPSGTAGIWGQFTANYRSSSSATSVTICISDSSNVVGGNDFAIDDITFNAVCIQKDSVRIHTYKKPAFTMPRDTIFCDTVNKILFPTITSDTTGETLHYLWLSDNSTNARDTFYQPGTYTLYVSNQCPNSSVNHPTILAKNLSPNPQLGSDATICNPTYLLAPSSPGTPPITHLWNDLSTGPTLTASATGDYWIRDSNQCGTKADTITLTFIVTPPAFSIGQPDTVICAGRTITLAPSTTPPSYDTLTWPDGSHGLSYSTTAAGRVDLKVTNMCGTSTDTSYVHLLGLPDAFSLGPDTTICLGNAVVLAPNPVPDSATFRWQDNSVTTNFNASTAGLYILNVFNGCFTIADSLTISTITLPPSFNLGINQGLCTNSSIVVRPAPSPIATDTLVWQDGTHSDTFVVTTPGTFTLSEINQCGTRTASVTFTPLLPPTVILDSLPVQCDQDSVMLDPKQTDAASYRWSNAATDTAIYAHSSGTYQVTVTNNCGTASAGVKVTMLRTPDRPFKGMTIDSCAGAQIVLDAGNPGHTYQWSSGFSGQVYTVDSGTFFITISDSGYCPVADTVYVLNHLCPHCRVLAPSAFTPNGDGKNDKFKPVFECSVQFYVVKIYNRWGELVYESYDQTDGWDGVLKAINQPIGVYQYFIHYKNQGSDEEKSVEGNVTLIR